MKYESGAKVQDLRIKIRESRFEIIEGVKITKPGIIIQFENGEFDSEKWQKEDPEIRSDALRELVEIKIERDPHFGQVNNPRGLWRMEEATKKISTPPQADGEPIPTKKCQSVEVVDGVGRECPNDAVPGADFCDDHILETV